MVSLESSGGILVGDGPISGTGPFTYRVSVSRDGGITGTVAERTTAALPPVAGGSQFVEPSRGRLLRVGPPGQLWHSEDGGRTWRAWPAP